MAKRRDRTIYTPQFHEADLAVTGEKLTYWKQILPKSKINYTDKDGETRVIEFDDQYLRDCVSSFANKAIDQTCFQLADSKNRHGRDFDPERQRAKVLDMTTLEQLPPDVKAKLGPNAKPGLYAKMQFFSKKAARAVRENPDLGVSARVRENFTRADGTFVKRAVIHVLGTIDPRVTGMSGWQSADLSYDPEDGYVLDLSEAHYEGKAMSKNGKAKGGTATQERPLPTNDEIDAMTEAELDAFLESQGLDPANLTANANDEGDDDGEDENDDDADDGDDEDEDGGGADDSDTTGASLSNSTRTRPKGSAKSQFDLANEQAQRATERANKALARQAAAEFKGYRSELIRAGVPPTDIDMCQPILQRADDMVIDLSNEGGAADVDVSGIVRKLLESKKGTIDMSNETGHGGRVDFANDETDPDKEALDAWEAQNPTGR